MSQLLQDFVDAVEKHVLDSLDMELADSLVTALDQITEMLVYKQEKGLDISVWHKHNKSVFNMLIRSLGVYNNFKLVNKPEPESITKQKQKVFTILSRLGELLPRHEESPDDKKLDFFEAQIKSYFIDQFVLGNEEEFKSALDKVKDWTMSSHRWRMFYVVLDLLKPAHLSFTLTSDKKLTVFELIS